MSINNGIYVEPDLNDIANGIIDVFILDTMPYDKRFTCYDGNDVLCHATGREVVFGNNPNEWATEYYNDYDDRFVYNK